MEYQRSIYLPIYLLLLVKGLPYFLAKKFSFISFLPNNPQLFSMVLWDLLLFAAKHLGCYLILLRTLEKDPRKFVGAIAFLAE